jgi:hypothetical protein|tara:strand:- start:5990 stop:6328 length:339 start_codon:yes stop_codon:yes gene_type:complete
MSEERKRVEKSIIVKPSPKKREEQIIPDVKKTKVIIKTEIKIEDLINPEIGMSESKKVRAKVSDDKYIRFSNNDYTNNKFIISEKILKNEMKFAYFALDGDDFYHYYILTKQ